MFDKQYIIDLFHRQWDRVERADIDRIVRDTGGISAFECVLMYLFILDRAPRGVLEFSPNHGYSTQALAMALRVLGIKKRFATFEIKKPLCDKTYTRMEKHGLLSYVDVIHGDALKKIPEWIGNTGIRVDFCFVDSDHTEGFANRYIKDIFPLLQASCLIGVHDIAAHKRDNSGQTAFKTSLGKGSKHAGEEKPINRHLKGKKFCVLHGITGGKHEKADLPNNDPFFNEILDLTAINFRKTKSKACPKTVYFINYSAKVEAKVAAVAKAAPIDASKDHHLFIVGMNDSGTTFLQNALSHCENCVSFKHPKHRPHGLEGQGASWWKKKNKAWYPRDIDHGIVKVFSEKKQHWISPGKFNWKEVKDAWDQMWKQNPHYKTASPRVFLEKTPSSLFSLPMYEAQFPGCRFLIIQRNPYVVCEGIRRTVKQHKKKDYSLTRCIEHWIQCTLQQMDNIKRLRTEGTAIWFKYEELVTRHNTVKEKIIKFEPALHDLDFTKPATCHSIDGNKPQPVKNYNNRQLKNLKPNEYAEMNVTLEKHMDIMKFFDYAIRTKAP